MLGAKDGVLPMSCGPGDHQVAPHRYGATARATPGGLKGSHMHYWASDLGPT